MIYVNHKLFERLSDVSGLKSVLQTAIELEHATIPPYLTALYSLKPTASSEITDRINEIMIEEMFHMTIAANILIAIGGAPKIATASFIPNYPSRLPGTIAGGNRVPIRSFSLELVRDVFMEIEEPENPLVFPFKATVAGVEKDTGPKTIGQFYRALQAAISQLGDGIFDPASSPRQVNRGIAKPVTDAKQAIEAIEKIIDQGEGTSASPLDPTGNIASDFAHYYSFAEIYHGKKLIPDAQTQFAYGGTPIPFNSNTDVWKMTDTPKTQLYRDLGLPNAVQASDEFNRAYTSLLKLLHETFNGNPNRLSAAVSVMRDLPDLAASLFQIPLGNGTQAGPTFEWLE